MFPIAFHPIYQHPCQKGIVFYAEIQTSAAIATWGTATQTDFFESEVCDLAPVLAIHQQEYK
jgi:hypothetical protein